MVPETVNRSYYANMYRQDTVGGKTTMYLVSTSGLSGRFTLDRVRHTTPNFRELLRLGKELPVLPYSFTKEVMVSPHGSPYREYVYIPNGDKSIYFGPDPNGYGTTGYLEPSSFTKANLKNALTNNLLTKVKAEYVNLGNFIGERKQCIGMLTSSMMKIANAGLALKKGNVQAAARHLTGHLGPKKSFKGTLANNWLELQYGWLPLISDCYGAAEALAAWPERHPLVLTSVKKSQKVSDSDTVLAPPMIYDRKYDYKIRAGCRFSVDPNSMHYLSQIGLTNPASIAWELTPFSFVVDWFLPVGKFLSSLDATIGCNFYDGYTNELLSSEIAAAGDGKTYTVGNFRDKTYSRGQTKLQRFSRTPLTGFPSIRLPQLKDPSSAQHCANALALLTQVFKR